MVCNCENVAETSLRVACLVELGAWKVGVWSTASPGNNMNALSDPMKAEILTLFKRATMMENCGYRAWHAWSLFNFRIALLHGENIGRVNDDGYRKSAKALKMLRNHVVVAVRGFVYAISSGTKKWCASVQQDLVNLLTCLFKYGHIMDIASVINESIVSVTNEAWLGVLPQLLARIHIKDPAIRSVLHPLLTRLGEKHPQALMYPLSVLLKSPVSERKNAAESLMNSLKKHSSELVEEALMVSSELIRVAILWLEIWHDGLEDASRIYFADGNVNGMLDLLLPLHEKLEEGSETRREKEFIDSFGQDLEKAHLHVKDYMRLSKEDSADEAEAAINKAWGEYCML